MTEMEILQQRIRSLERRTRTLTALFGLAVAAILIGADRQDDVLRARGLVITDAGGRDRIVLGAPMAHASRDPKLAETVGLAVLDASGRLHVSVGADNPLVYADGGLGERVDRSAGITIYDPRHGGERGGMGAFMDGRANVCLDYGAGKEAACMAVAPTDAYAAVILNGTPEEPQFDRVTMYVGADGTGVLKAFGGGKNEGGVLIVAGSGPPSVTAYDSTGQVIADLVERAR